MKRTQARSQEKIVVHIVEDRGFLPGTPRPRYR